MKIILYAMGTMGDIIPYINIGVELKKNGHEVVCISNEIAKRVVESFDLEFHQLTPRSLFEETYFNELTWTPIGGDFHFQKYHIPAIEPSYKYVEMLVNSGERPLIVSQYEINGAKMAADKYGLPYINILLSPSSVKSVISPVYPLSEQVAESDRLTRMPEIYSKMKRDFKTKHVDTLINPIRNALGLPAWDLNDIPEEGQSKQIVALFSDWFKDAPNDWPDHIYFAGFPENKNVNNRNEDLVDAFIKANGKPLVFTIGSGVLCKDQEVIFAKEVCKKLDMPGIFVSPTVENIIRHVDETFLCVKYMNFSNLLSRCALLVHHGGIGTCAAAMAGGIPQLVRPLTFDQPDNAYCMYKLGISNAISGHKHDVDSAVVMIRELLDSESVASNLEEIRKKIEGSKGTKNCSDYICRYLAELDVSEEKYSVA